MLITRRGLLITIPRLPKTLRGALWCTIIHTCRPKTRYIISPVFTLFCDLMLYAFYRRRYPASHCSLRHYMMVFFLSWAIVTRFTLEVRYHETEWDMVAWNENAVKYLFSIPHLLSIYYSRIAAQASAWFFISVIGRYVEARLLAGEYRRRIEPAHGFRNVPPSICRRQYLLVRTYLLLLPYRGAD